jgi:hypothetical protein
LCTHHSFSGYLLTKFTEIQAAGVDEYFKHANVVMCPEQAPSTGEWHIHAGIILNNVCSRRQLQAIFGPWDFRPMKGSPSQVKEYILKNGGMAVYVGDPSVWDTEEQGQRRPPPIDWSYVIGCCNTVRSFKQFKNNFIDQGDDNVTELASSSS